jgi:hypothetical protein
MTARIHPLRPRFRPRFVAVPSSSRSSEVSSWHVWPVGFERDEECSVHLARCRHCADSLASPDSTEVETWANTHVCDPDLVGGWAA